MRRILEFVRLVEAEDPRFLKNMAKQIRECTLSEAWESKGEAGKLFQASYLMTILMLYAAAGGAMDATALAVLRKKEYDREALWQAYNQPSSYEDCPTVFLTVHSGLIQDNLLPAHRFFGREEELFNLKETAALGGKCMIAGVGGAILQIVGIPQLCRDQSAGRGASLCPDVQNFQRLLQIFPMPAVNGIFDEHPAEENAHHRAQRRQSRHTRHVEGQQLHGHNSEPGRRHAHG